MNFATHDFPGPPTLRYAEGPADGPALLLLHGVTRCWREWESLMPDFAKDSHLFALDQRGHGSSGRATRYLVTDYIADAARFVREVISAPVVIHGHSLGAMVAAGVAAQVPELVRGISLEDPPFHTMGNRISTGAWQAQFNGQRDAMLRGGSIEQLADALAEIRLPTASGGTVRLGDLRDRASLLWNAQCLSQLDPEVLTSIIEGHWLDGYDLPGIFSGIRCPVLLLQADPAAGGTLTDADVVRIKEALPRCKHVRFPGASHLLHRDQPQAMLAAVREFAAELP